MKKKLTLLSLYCSGRALSVFCILPTNTNGKPYITQSIIDSLFCEFFGFIPHNGSTISIG